MEELVMWGLCGGTLVVAVYRVGDGARIFLQECNTLIF